MEETKNEKTTDPFSRLMFREDNSAKTEQTRNNSDWILGRTASEPKKETIPDKVEQILHNVDLKELMTNVETLMSSVDELKPLIKKASPLLQKFLK